MAPGLALLHFVFPGTSGLLRVILGSSLLNFIFVEPDTRLGSVAWLRDVHDQGSGMMAVKKPPVPLVQALTNTEAGANRSKFNVQLKAYSRDVSMFRQFPKRRNVTIAHLGDRERITSLGRCQPFWFLLRCVLSHSKALLLFLAPMRIFSCVLLHAYSPCAPG